MPRVRFVEIVLFDTGDLEGEIDVEVDGWVHWDDETDMYTIDILGIDGCLTIRRGKAVEYIDISQALRINDKFVEQLESQVIESHPKGRP